MPKPPPAFTKFLAKPPNFPEPHAFSPSPNPSLTPNAPHPSPRKTMATPIPDPLTFATWEEPFHHHPLPSIRKFSSHLRRHLADTDSTLRARIGARYPDLLAVADRIVDMDAQTSDLHNRLGELGQRCDARGLERGGGNLGRFLKTRRECEMGRMLAETKVLMNTVRVAGRMMTMMMKKKQKRGLRVGWDALTVAKLLVLARLLWKSIVEDPSSTSLRPPAVLEDLRRNLTALRRRLMGLIERTLLVRTEEEDQEKEILSRTLAAYALLTSSPPPQDLLRHFLHVRAQQLDAASSSPEGVREKLEIYTRTLSDARALFPRVLAAQLADLGRGPLLADVELAALVDFDGLGFWVSEEVGRFTPWTQVGGLGSDEVRRVLLGWARQARDGVVRAVRGCVAGLREAEGVLGVRREVVGSFLGLMVEEGEEDYAGTVGEVRRACVERLHTLVCDAAGDGVKSILDDIDARISSATHDENEKKPPPPSSPDVWILAMTKASPLDLSTPSLRQKVLLSRRHGRDDALLSAYCAHLDSWTHTLLRLHDLIRGMRTSKWDIDDDVEDALCHDLNVHDPDAVQAAFTHAVRVAWRAIYGWARASAARGEEPGSVARLLRILRETNGRWSGFVGEFGDDDLGVQDVRVDDDTVRVLHVRLAEDVVQRPLARYIVAASAATEVKVPVGLWDVDGLPVQPSPDMFRFVVGLQTGMREVGADLWGSGAVGALREKVGDALPLPAEREGEEEAGEEEKEEGEIKRMTSGEHQRSFEEGQTRLVGDDVRKARSLQDLFDGMYVTHILSSGHHPASGSEGGVARLRRRMDELRKRVVELDEASHERLKKNVAEYWKRTYLMFGLLAGG